MLLLAGIIALLSIFEINKLYRERQKKEIAVFVFFAVIAFALGAFYISNPLRKSLAYHMLALLGFYK